MSPKRKYFEVKKFSILFRGEKEQAIHGELKKLAKGTPGISMNQLAIKAINKLLIAEKRKSNYQKEQQ
jgi:hypothetical protein